MAAISAFAFSRALIRTGERIDFRDVLIAFVEKGRKIAVN